MNDNASTHGSYLLLLECDHKRPLQVGKLGSMHTVPGYYLYVGSAFGPGGVRARVKHHQQISLRPHWHIDYLRAAASVLDAWCVYGFRYEHEWAQALIQHAKIQTPLKGFGASDCDCMTHLFYLQHKPGKAMLQRLLGVNLESVDI